MRKIIICLLLLLPIVAPAQPMDVDSLVNLLNTQKTAKEQLTLYNQICDIYVLYDLEKASEYAKKGIALAEKENDKLMLSKLNAMLGRIHNIKSEYETAFFHWEKAYDLALEIKDKTQEGAALVGIAILNGRQGNFVSSLDYFLKALAIYENMGNKKSSIVIMSNIASSYRVMDNFEMAIYYLEKAKKIAEEIEDDNGKMQTYFELGAIYANPLMNNEDEKNIKKALDYALKSYEISRFLNNKAYQACAAEALSVIYYDYLKEYDLAFDYANACLKAAEELGDQTHINGAWNLISNYYRVTERYKESEEYALKAWETDSTNRNTGINLLENIITANILLGNSDKANLFFGKYTRFIMTHIDQSNREIMAEMETKYETEKKELQIAALEGEKTLYIGLGISLFVAFLLGVGFLVNRHRLVVQKKKLAEQQIMQLEQEKKMIAVQSSLKAEKTERDLIAHDLHDSVSSMLTVVKNNMNLYSASAHKETGYFNNAFEVLSKSILELRRVVYHLKSFILTKEGLAAALDDFCCFIPNAEFHCNSQNRRFDPVKEYVLYDSACELINNALKHADASRIDVHLNIDTEVVYLAVADNGKGFDPLQIKPGIGLENIRSNLSAFGGQLNILSGSNMGTEANIEMEI